MEKKKQQKKWQRPMLVVLSRGKPEESVLLFCKMGTGGNGPNVLLTDCLIDQNWNPCESWTNS